MFTPLFIIARLSRSGLGNKELKLSFTTTANNKLPRKREQNKYCPHNPWDLGLATLTPSRTSLFRPYRR